MLRNPWTDSSQETPVQHQLEIRRLGKYVIRVAVAVLVTLAFCFLCRCLALLPDSVQFLLKGAKLSPATLLACHVIPVEGIAVFGFPAVIWITFSWSKNMDVKTGVALTVASVVLSCTLQIIYELASSMAVPAVPRSDPNSTRIVLNWLCVASLWGVAVLDIASSLQERGVLSGK